MSDITFDIDVHDADIADQLERRIEDGMENAVSPSRPDSLGHKMKAAARNHIRAHGRIWTTELIDSFDITSETQGDSVHLVLRNDAGHAAAIDVGAEYGDEGPPLHKLIPWVEAKLKGYRVRGGMLVKYADDPGGKTILTDGSGNKPYVTQELPADYEAGIAISFSEIGTDAGVNRDSAYMIDYPELGEKAYFQTYKNVDLGSGGISGSQFGTVRNEELFTRVSMEADWSLGPENRGGTVMLPMDEEILEGNFQSWIQNSEQLRSLVEQPHHPQDVDMEWTPTEFLEEHGDWFSRTTAVDILIGNGDRHLANIVVDEDLKPHAIDNGGHSLPSGSSLADRISTSSVHVGSELQDIDFYDGLEQELVDHFDRQLSYLEELLRNNSDAILEHTKDVHGEQSALYARMEAILDAEVDEVLSVVEDKQDKVMHIIRGSGDFDQDAYSDITYTLDSNGLSLDSDDEGVLRDVLDDFDEL